MADVVLGMLVAATIAAIVAYAIYLYLKPLNGKRSCMGVAITAMVALWLVKTAALHWCPGYFFDIDENREWARHLAAVGPAHFYGPGYSYEPLYPPVTIYALWPAGWLERFFGLSWDNFRIPVETPVLMADFIIAITMFGYLRRAGRSLAIAWTGMLMVALNPALVFDTVGWNQSDAIVSALMWMATLAALDAEYILAGVLLALAVQTKPHALVLIPLLLFWVWRNARFVRLWAPAGAFLATTIVVAIPFGIGRPWDWLPRFYLGGMESFHETSVNAFNLLAIIGGLRQAETGKVLGVSYFALGMALMIGVMVLACVQVWRRPFPASLMLAAFLALFAEFLFAPRMHERYLFPAIVFFAPIAVEGLFWMVVFILLTASWFFNLAYVFHILRTTFWLDAHDGPAMLSAALNLVLFGAVLARLSSLRQDAVTSGASPEPAEAPRPSGPLATEETAV